MYAIPIIAQLFLGTLDLCTIVLVGMAVFPIMLLGLIFIAPLTGMM